MMKTIFVLLTAMLCCLNAQAQKRMQIPSGCAFSTDVKNTNPYIFEPDPQAQQIVGDICRAIGISQGFQLQSADVKNALACERDGVRFVLYNTDFLKDVQTDARTKWAAYGVLAHEIGHHVNGHHFGEDNSERRKELELEADRFSGSALRLLGATKDEAKSAVASLLNSAETNSHPPPSARNLAVVNGWNDQNTRLRNMIGIDGVNDPNGQSGTKPVVRDRDGDGVPDGQDACPEIPGEMLLNGCPDGDLDGIPDDKDECPYKKGEARWNGCPDSDDDGIPDNKDNCPYLRGELADDGCPPPDDDHDGIPNLADRCPTQPGSTRYRGCPDTDSDGVPDPDDKCPQEKGDPNFGGCLSPVTPGLPVASANSALQKLIGNRKSGLTFKSVEGGTYTMGSPANESGRYDNECQHNVTVRNFKMGIYEVTQADWRAIMGSDPADLYNKGCDDCPVERVSWDDIQQFLTKLKEKTGQTFRLPTEEEWEYAARGGKLTKGYLYSGSNNVGDVAWYDENYKDGNMFGSAKNTHPVGTKQPNELGLYDMSGNVWEWCQDTYKPYSCDSKNTANTSVRVLRGGSGYVDTRFVRVADRYGYGPTNRYNFVGFRLAQD